LLHEPGFPAGKCCAWDAELSSKIFNIQVYDALWFDCFQQFPHAPIRSVFKLIQQHGIA
jgi:hypothetical protein